MDEPKYEYFLLTWGGFYNDIYKKNHLHEPGERWFDSKEERTEYIDKLRKIELDMNAKYLMTSEGEGYDARIRTVAHRVVRIISTGKLVYSEYDFGPCYPINVALYHIKYKWTPGFNDDAAINDENDIDKIIIVSEWITGSSNKQREDYE
jgi:hypothetical protein